MSGTRSRGAAERGVTLIEVLIAVTLLSMLSVAMLFAMRVGLTTFTKADAKLMEGRRVAGTQRILADEIEGMIPVVAPCSGKPEMAALKVALFQGEPETMRLVSAFSLQQGWRGQPQILEFTVIPGENGGGVRLVVNEIPYAGPLPAGKLCMGAAPDPETAVVLPKFAPVETGATSFVLADKLEFCRFSYLTPGKPPDPTPVWKPKWTSRGWPRGIRVEMAPMTPDPARVQPVTVTAPLRFYRDPEIQYEDF
jgi:prepilin-type N-terminal cleavage/methylation domain-containing protein